MPTYQYACTDCGHDFEAVQSFSDDALTQCPECSGRLRKLFGNVGVVFKGSGFYRTDSRSGSDSSTTDSAKTDSAKSDSKSGSKSDSKSSSSTSPSSTSSSSSGTASSTTSSA